MTKKTAQDRIKVYSTQIAIIDVPEYVHTHNRKSGDPRYKKKTEKFIFSSKNLKNGPKLADSSTF